MHFTFELIHTAYTTDQLKTFEEANYLPQVAFAGRSNVGKSTLINALAKRKELAKTSSTPGKTKSINFYMAKPANFYLVDLPGYGYARCSKEERAKWAKLINNYITRSGNLRFVSLLIDCRLPPQTLDVELARFVRENNIPLLPLLTKTDKCSQKDRNIREGEWLEIIGKDARIFMVSGKTGLGVEDFLTALYGLVGSDGTI